MPLAMVNGEPVYTEDAERQLAETHQQVNEGMRADFDLDQLVFRLVNDALLAQEARAMELETEEPIPGKLEALRRDLAVKHLELDEVWKPATASEQEIRDTFEHDYQRVTLRVLTTLEKADAEAALAELRDGADFAALVGERSVDPYKLRGGLVEDLARVDLQSEIATAAFAAEPGDLVGPVRTSIGWSLVRVESFAPAEAERFAAVHRDVRDVIRFRKAQELKAAFAARLRERHPVSVDTAVLAAIEPERQTDARLVPKVADPAAVVARAGDESVTAGELGDALMWRWKGIRNDEAARATTPLVLDGLLESKLLLDEALARGYDRTAGGRARGRRAGEGPAGRALPQDRSRSPGPGGGRRDEELLRGASRDLQPAAAGARQPDHRRHPGGGAGGRPPGARRHRLRLARPPRLHRPLQGWPGASAAGSI